MPVLRFQHLRTGPWLYVRTWCINPVQMCINGAFCCCSRHRRQATCTDVHLSARRDDDSSSIGPFNTVCSSQPHSLLPSTTLNVEKISYTCCRDAPLPAQIKAGGANSWGRCSSVMAPDLFRARRSWYKCYYAAIKGRHAREAREFGRQPTHITNMLFVNKSESLNVLPCPSSIHHEHFNMSSGTARRSYPHPKWARVMFSHHLFVC